MKSPDRFDVMSTILATGVALIVLILGLGVAAACEGTAHGQTKRPASATQTNHDGSVSASATDHPHICRLDVHDAQTDGRDPRPEHTHEHHARASIGSEQQN